MGAWVTHDLSAFLGDGDLYGGSNREAWDGTYLSRISGTQWRFALPDLTLGPTDVTDIEITYGATGQDPSSGFDTSLLIALDALSGATFDESATLGSTDLTNDSHASTPDGLVFTVRIGPSIYVPDDFGFQANFDAYVATGDRPYMSFRQVDGLTQIAQIRTRIVEAAPPDNPGDDGAFLFAPPQRFLLAPLRAHPRSDGLGTSSAPRVWPPPPSVQASNRRAGGYL